ncbi:MAG: hypothetical protein ACXAC7_00310 [Candidatus Hodarchaeales archaeon]|jgi:hypothetical protein
MIDKLGVWKYSIILIGIVLVSLVLGINFISNDSEEYKTFNIDQTVSNPKVSLSLKNFTYNNALIHNDQIEITVFIRNSSNLQPLVNVHFSLFVHRFFVKYMPEMGSFSKNINDLLDSPLITNESGIAVSQLRYSHDTWPIYYGWGKLEINTTIYPKTKAYSDELMFSYLNITEQRKSGHPEGINIIKRLEMRDVVNESKEISSPDNAYRNLSIYYPTRYYWYVPYKTINKSCIEHYKDRIKYDTFNYRLDVEYLAYAMPLNYSFLNMMLLEVIMEEIVNIDYNSYWFERPKTGELNDITFTTGWIVFQQLKYNREHDALNGSFLRFHQVIILDTNETILWMMSDFDETVA